MPNETKNNEMISQDENYLRKVELGSAEKVKLPQEGI
jgi:hypothetical protein